MFNELTKKNKDGSLKHGDLLNKAYGQAKKNKDSKGAILKAVLGLGSKLLKGVAVVGGLATGGLLGAAVGLGVASMGQRLHEGISLFTSKEFKKMDSASKAAAIEKWGGTALKGVGIGVAANMLLPGLGGVFNATAVTTGVGVLLDRYRGRVRGGSQSGFANNYGTDFRSPGGSFTGTAAGNMPVQVGAYAGASASASASAYASVLVNSQPVIDSAVSGQEMVGDTLEDVARFNFNMQALSDQNYVMNQQYAYANVVINKVGTKAGQAIAGNAISTYAANNTMTLTEAFIGGNINGKNVTGLLSPEQLIALYKSTMSSEQLATFKAQGGTDAAAQLAFIQQRLGLKLSVGQNRQTGALSFAVQDANGVVKNASAEARNEALRAALRHDAISVSGVNASITATNYTANIRAELAKNLGLGMDFTSEVSGHTQGLTNQAILDMAAQNEDMVAEAILAHVSRDKDSDLYKQFALDNRIGDDTSREQILGQIKSSLRNGTGFVSTLRPEDYNQEFSAVVQRHVEDGTFKVSAWDLNEKGTNADYAEHLGAGIAALGKHNVLDNLGKNAQDDILANVAINRALDYDGEARAMIDKAYADNISNEDLAGLDASKIAELTGREDANKDNLTTDELQLLGYMKAASGGNLAGIDKADAYRDAFKNKTASYYRAFGRMDNKGKIVRDKNLTDRYAVMATQNALLGMNVNKLAETQAKFTKDNLNALNPETRAQLEAEFKKHMGDANASLANASEEDLAKFYRHNHISSKRLMGEMEGYSFTQALNPNFVQHFARTAEERAQEHSMSVDTFKANSDAMFNTFINSEVEGKGDIVDSLMAKTYGLDDPNSQAYKDILAQIQASKDYSSLKANYTDQELVLAFKKAQLSGEKDAIGNITNYTATAVRGVFTDRGIEMQRVANNIDNAAILRGMQADSSINIGNVSTRLTEDYLTPEQRNRLMAEGADNGFKAISENEQNALLLELAAKDQAVQDELKKAGVDTKDNAAVLAHLNSAAGKKTKEALVSKASQMSLYEIKNRGNGAEAVYNSIKAKTAEAKRVQNLYNQQGGLISNEDVQRYMADDASDDAHADEMADYVASRFTVLNEAEESFVSADAQYRSFEATMGADFASFNSTDSSNEQANARLDYYATRYADEVEKIKSSSAYAALSTDEEKRQHIIDTMKNAHKDDVGADQVAENAHKKKVVDAINASTDEKYKTSKAIAAAAGNTAVIRSRAQFIASGGMKRYNDVVAEIENDRDLMKEADKVFRAANNGKSLKDVDEITRNNFLFSQYKTFTAEGSDERKKIESKMSRMNIYTEAEAEKAKADAGQALATATQERENYERQYGKAREAVYSGRGSAAIQTEITAAQSKQAQWKKLSGDVNAELSKAGISGKLLDRAPTQILDAVAEVGTDIRAVQEYLDKNGIKLDDAVVKQSLSVIGNADVRAIRSDYKAGEKQETELQQLLKDVKVVESDPRKLERLMKTEGHARARAISTERIAERVKNGEIILKGSGVSQVDISSKKVIESLSGTQFERVAKEMTDAGSTVIEGAKKGIIETVASTTTDIVDPSKLSKKEYKNYTFTKSLLQQQYRKDPNQELFTNAFRNTTLVNEDSAIRDILSKGNRNASAAEIEKARIEALMRNQTVTGSTMADIFKNMTHLNVDPNKYIEEYWKGKGVDFSKISDVERGNYVQQAITDGRIRAALERKATADGVAAGELTKEFGRMKTEFENRIKNMNATNDQIKAGLTNEQIADFLRRNETARDKLIDVAAMNPTAIFDRQAFEAQKRIETLNSDNLRAMLSKEVLNQIYDPTQLQSMIKRELSTQGSSMYSSRVAGYDPAMMDKYVRDHWDELVRRFGDAKIFSRGADGNYTVNNHYTTQVNQAMSRMEGNEQYKSTVRKIWDKIIKAGLGEEEEHVDSDNELDDRDKVRRLYWRLMRVAKRDKKVEEMIGDGAENRIKYMMGEFASNPEVEVKKIITYERTREPSPEIAERAYRQQNSRTNARIRANNQKLSAAMSRLSKLESSD